MERKNFEVVIVGGGPAGSTCGYELAKAGVDVAIFDHSHPREKPCGGALAGRFFDDFEVPKGVSKRIIDWIILEDQHGHRVRLYQKFGGVTIMRREFDHKLFKKAQKAGALCVDKRVTDIEEKGGYWIIKTKKRKYKTKFLVGADGCPSRVRRYVVGDISKEHLSHGIGYHIPHDGRYLKRKFENAIELYFLGKPYVQRGYMWIFPKQDYVTVGLGTMLGTAHLRQSLRVFIKNHPAAKRILMPEKISLHSHLIPFANSPSFYNHPTTGKKWVLIGDAAGHVNPITGEGIYYAMMGGRLAAKAYLEGNISAYEKYWREKYGGDLYWGTRLKNIFYNPKVIGIAIKMGNRSQAMREILADVIGSRVKYNVLVLRKLPKMLPKILLQQLFD
jgi:geranylgeranyl reductase family protein